MYIETSKDILFLVISFCVLWVTFFLCWMFYYLTRILKNANQVIEEFRLKLQAITDGISYVRGKVEHISDFVSLATGGVGGAVKNMVSRKAKQWMSAKEEDFDTAAKDAVDKAVDATARKMKKAVSKMRK